MGKTKLSELEKKLAETEAALKRTLADYANLEKRVAAEREVMGKLALAGIVSKLIPVLDNLDKVCQHNKDSGILMVAKQFREVLTSVGIREIGLVGEKFDPNLHEAVEVVKDEDDGKIVEVVNPGFVIDGETIRPARVKVGKSDLSQETKKKGEKAKNFGDYA